MDPVQVWDKDKLVFIFFENPVRIYGFAALIMVEGLLRAAGSDRCSFFGIKEAGRDHRDRPGVGQPGPQGHAGRGPPGVWKPDGGAAGA